MVVKLEGRQTVVFKLKLLKLSNLSESSSLEICKKEKEICEFFCV